MIARLVDDAGRQTRSRYEALRRGSLAATAMMLGVVTYVPPVMAAIDLTGTWEGRCRCKDVTSGAEIKPGGTLTMTVTQSVGEVNAFVAWYGPDLVPYRSEAFQGHVQGSRPSPGKGPARSSAARRASAPATPRR